MSTLSLSRVVRSVLTAAASGLVFMLPAAFETAVAGPGQVCRDGVTAPDQCAPADRIGTYYANSERPLVTFDVNGKPVSATGGLRKFIDTLPGLTAAGASQFARGQSGEYIPLAEPDPSVKDSNSYVIGVIEHEQWMHSDLQKPTLLRSYVQLYPATGNKNAPAPTPGVSAYTGQRLPTPVALKRADGTPITWPGTGEQVYAYDKPHYLGPIILTVEGTPVRVQMVNFLPTGAATITSGTVTRNGDMFLPVDQSLGGAGDAPTAGQKYAQNRAAFHLHGGDSPWISDGTPHQWISAVGDPTPFKRGDRLFNAPDRADPGDGAQNIFWPNDQSARLMWYHDHTFGLTRQNAYAGEAAGYVIIDTAELALLGLNGNMTPAAAGVTINGQTINKALPGGLLEQVVLVVQDKSFVPSDIAVQDSKWDTAAWGKPGDLWYPHVYEPFQLWSSPVGGSCDPAAVAPLSEAPAAFGPAGTSALNPSGRWDYATDPNGLYQPPGLALHADKDFGCVAFPEGGYTAPSAVPEAYMDTPLVNGVAYPVMHVQPKAYRVRFLNGANDRYFNMSIWKADPTQPALDGSGRLTEVAMVPADGATYDVNGTSVTVPNDGRPGGVPDPRTAGPHIVQFANEAGVLPHVVDYAPKAMSGIGDPLAGFVLARGEGDFYLASAERADTVIDFSGYAGQTLIVYNDSAAPVPGGDPRYDYYTNDPDMTTVGGAPSTVAGFGPNTRTIMQIVVDPVAQGAIPATTFDVAKLDAEVNKAFLATADKPVTPALAASVDLAGNSVTLTDGTTVPVVVKTIEGFTDPNFGRLIAQLGTEFAPGAATPLAYVDTPTDIVETGKPTYWLLKNNDGDNHPMHFHLFNVQVLGRVDQATGNVVPPQADESGWKETVKNWPGEDVIVALKVKTPQLPFGLPRSKRLMDPTLPAAAATSASGRPGVTPTFEFFQFDVTNGLPMLDGTGLPMIVKNTTQDYDWEYVWHCHILGHEENDLMRPLVFHPTDLTAPASPSSVAVSATGAVSWTDPTPAASAKGSLGNEYGFRVERAAVSHGVVGAYAPLPTAARLVDNSSVNTLANATQFQDTLAANTDYRYRVIGVNSIGESAPSNVASLVQAPAAATSLAAVASASVGATNAVTVHLTWNDVASNETSYSVTRVDNSTTPATTTVIAAALPAASTSFDDSITGLTAVTAAKARTYTVTAINSAGSAVSAPVSFTPGIALAAPAALTGSYNATAKSVTLGWTDQSVGETGYAVLRATGTVNGTTGAVTYGAAARLPKATSVLAANLATYADATAAANAVYQYQVEALNGATVGPVASVVVPTATTLAAPTQLASGGGATKTALILKWQASTNALVTGYAIQRCLGTATTCTAASTAWVSVGMVAGRNTVKYTDAGLVTKTSYSYRVKSVSAVAPAATAAWSTTLTQKTL
jgi:FtsP/CotA-like multicopper oxidase with cupredoxin domain